MAPRVREKEGGLGVKYQNSFDHAMFALRKRPFLAQSLTTYTPKGCRNERAEMKESRLNDREIRVQDDTITENTNARSLLIFRNFL